MFLTEAFKKWNGQWIHVHSYFHIFLNYFCWFSGRDTWTQHCRITWMWKYTCVPLLHGLHQTICEARIRQFAKLLFYSDPFWIIKCLPACHILQCFTYSGHVTLEGDSCRIKAFSLVFIQKCRHRQLVDSFATISFELVLCSLLLNPV